MSLKLRTRTVLGNAARSITRSTSSSSTSSSSVLRDRRLAGRRRFYRNVDIELLSSAPWEESSSSFTARERRRSEDDKHNVVACPISAGVDGTNSATGVESHLMTNSRNNNSAEQLLKHYLTPRKPGNATNDTATTKELQWYGVTLDGRRLQTPLGQTLAVPSALWATQIAVEWDAVETTLNPTQMPCMTLTCTVLDQTAYHPKPYQTQVLNFCPTDTICYWADPSCPADRILYQRQEQAWRKIHDHVKAVTGIPLATVTGAEQGLFVMTANPKQHPNHHHHHRGLPHDPILLEYASDFVHSLDAWHLCALQCLAVEAKSFWLPWALLTTHHHPDNHDKKKVLPRVFTEVADAVQASRVEEEYQISNWGLVEGQHDYDRLNTSISVSAALLLAHSLAADCH